ncbi:MAG: hypothetical protein RJA07_1348 [Bacteroidota bacterium]|jgi:2-C-methyl-D-erythritol 4-phosphate cytidylyltransferase
MNNTNKFAIIVAGGSGTRMNTDVPKQFLLLHNKPIIVHSIEKFLLSDAAIKIIIVLPQSQLERWNTLKTAYPFLQSIKIAIGGKTRFESVKNGLDEINENGIVAIHDAVRPLITKCKIIELYSSAEQNGNAIPALPCVDTIRFEKEKGKYELMNRNKMWLMQTPQCFMIKQIKDAYLKAEHIEYTDDAAVIEAADYSINLVQGDKNNLKITVPEDLKLAEFLMGNFN